MLRITHRRLFVFLAAASLVACLDRATAPTIAANKSMAADTSSPPDTSTPPDTTPPDTTPPDTTPPPDTTYAGIIRGFVLGIDSSVVPPRITPLSRATIVVRRRGNDSLPANVRERTGTDSAGAFLFSGLPRGVYTLEARAPRYRRVELHGVVPGASLLTTPPLTIVLQR